MTKSLFIVRDEHVWAAAGQSEVRGDDEMTV